VFNLSNRRVLTSLAAIGLLLNACGTTKPSRFYTLSSLPQSESAATVAAQTEYGTIGVGPVSIPQYLERPQIVTRVSPNRFEFAEFDRWGGTLKDDFTRTLAENLTYLIPAERVARHPWRRTVTVEYQIPVEVIRFDGALGRDILLNVEWQILSNGGDTQLHSKRSIFKETVAGSNYDDMVAAQSRAVAELAQEIADTLMRLKEKPSRPQAGGAGDR
jgi:uncharacterized lipoprotein YmbA